VLVLLAACSLAPDAFAQDTTAAIPAASGETMNSLLGRIAPATLAAAPRLTVEHERVLDDERAPASRTGLDAYGRPLVELGGVTYRWWVNRGASNFGVGVGAMGYVAPPTEPGGAQSLTYGSSVLTLGWRYQVDDHSTLFADASSARRFDAGTNDRIGRHPDREDRGARDRGAARSGLAGGRARAPHPPPHRRAAGILTRAD